MGFFKNPIHIADNEEISVIGMGMVDTTPVLDPDQLTANQLGLLRGLLKQLQDGTMKTEINGSLANIESIGIDVTSATVAVELTTGLMTDKTQLIIYPPIAGLIYWGSTETDLATNGAPLSAGDTPLEFNFAVAGGFPIYAVNDGTSRNVRVVESK